MVRIQDHSTNDILEEFWRRYDQCQITEESLLYQLECSYPEEALASLKAFCAQPVVDRHKLFAWCWALGSRTI